MPVELQHWITAATIYRGFSKRHDTPSSIKISSVLSKSPSWVSASAFLLETYDEDIEGVSTNKHLEPVPHDPKKQKWT
jgi:hypothetical protein